MIKKINKTIEELWQIAQEINKKELSKDEVCKKYGLSSRKYTDLIRETNIKYKNNKEGYVYEDVTKETSAMPLPSNSKKVGRPQKYSKGHTELKKLTLEIDKSVYTALQFKKITENIAINKFIEDLLKKNIEQCYFDSVENLNNK